MVRGEDMSQEIQRKLERLYPGENSVQRYQKYRLLQKRLTVFLMLLGAGVGICSHLWGQKNVRMQEEGRLPRNEWGGGSYEITLSAEVGEMKENISYVIEERQYTDEELLQLLTQVTELLPEKMKGLNESLSCVRSNLELPTQLKGYPFVIRWRSYNDKTLRTDGTVNTKGIPAQGEEVVLTATFSCQGQSFCREFLVRLYPEIVSERAQKLMQLQEMLAESDEQSKQENRILLPQRLGEEQIIWKEHTQSQSGYFLMLGVLGAIAAVWGMNRDLTKKDDERRKELTSFYPEFVSSLQLYLGAGLSLRNAFFRIGNDYCVQKQQDGKKLFLYEEVVLACNQLTNGMPESEVYRKWAERCDEVHYRRLGYLLTSYSRQGNSNILRQLGKEARGAWEECRMKAVKQGEEAGTKLLFPMVLMLLVVMVLILLPVYVSF